MPWIILALHGLASWISGHTDDRHLTTDPACEHHRPPRPGSWLDRVSRGVSCTPCMARRAFYPEAGGIAGLPPTATPASAPDPTNRSRGHAMKSDYGDWESQGEEADMALWQVAGMHHVFATANGGMTCMCGARPITHRGATEHIIDQTVKALAVAGIIRTRGGER